MEQLNFELEVENLLTSNTSLFNLSTSIVLPLLMPFHSLITPSTFVLRETIPVSRVLYNRKLHDHLPDHGIK